MKRGEQTAGSSAFGTNEEFIMEGGEKAVLLIHGFTGAPASMYPLAVALNQAGYSCEAVLLPGHCTSMEDLEQTNERVWFECVEKRYREMRKRYTKVAVAGLSLGGVLALRLAELEEPDACVVFSPALKFRQWFFCFSPIVKHFAKTFDFGGGRSRKPRKEKPEKAGFLKEYNPGYKSFSIAKTADIQRFDRIVRRELGRINAPLLIVQSSKDELVNPKVVRIVTERINSQVRRTMLIDKSPHVCILGQEREAIFKQTVEFLETNL